MRHTFASPDGPVEVTLERNGEAFTLCLLYTSDAADE